MKTEILPCLKRSAATIFFAAAILFSGSLAAQQHIIAGKDNTRPETTHRYNSFNLVNLSAVQNDGYDQIQWQAPADADASRFFIEYSFDGVNFLRGEEVMNNNGLYNYRHVIPDTRPLMYRVRVEHSVGSWSHSGAIMPKDIAIAPVQLQKNVIDGNMINISARLPVQRLTIVSGAGNEVYARDVNGQRDFIPVAIPRLGRGVYIINFFGNGWKSSSRFVIAG